MSPEWHNLRMRCSTWGCRGNGKQRSALQRPTSLPHLLPNCIKTSSCPGGLCSGCDIRTELQWALYLNALFFLTPHKHRSKYSLLASTSSGVKPHHLQVSTTLTSTAACRAHQQPWGTQLHASMLAHPKEKKKKDPPSSYWALFFFLMGRTARHAKSWPSFQDQTTISIFRPSHLYHPV